MENPTCPICMQSFRPNKRRQVYCSVLCRNRFAGRHPGGFRKKEDLAERRCEACGAPYMPVRDSQRACSRRCYDDVPDRVSAQREYDHAPTRRERRNLERRVVTDPARHGRNRQQNLRKYGLTLEMHDSMLAAQGGRCAICGDLPDPNGVRAYSRLHVDHDHDSGRVRALLCGRCNAGLGFFRDDENRLQAAVLYLKEFKHRSDHTERHCREELA